MLKGSAPHQDGAVLRLDATQPTAIRTRLLRPQKPGLLPSGFLQSARRQPTGRGDGHFFHLGQIDIQPRPRIPKGASNNNFSPALGQIGDTLEIFGGQFP